MAQEASMRAAIRRVVQAFYHYAHDQQWSEKDFAVFVRPETVWGQIHVIFVARQFPGKHIEDRVLSVINYVENDLKDEPGLSNSITLSIRTFDQVEEGGIYSLNSAYIDASEFADTIKTP